MNGLKFLTQNKKFKFFDLQKIKKKKKFTLKRKYSTVINLPFKYKKIYFILNYLVKRKVMIIFN
jgi:hypothetical protein